MEQVHSSSSSRMVKGLHRFTLEGYSQYKGISCGATVYSSSFTVGGHQWAIGVYPNGTCSRTAKKVPEVYVGICVCLLSGTKERVTCFPIIMLLDQTGQGNHRTKSSFRTSKGPPKFATNEHLGCPTFLLQKVLEDSCYLKDDCLKIECTLAIPLPSKTDIQIERPISQCGDNDDDYKVSDFCAILESGECSDVTIYVRRMRFPAHKVILATRSSFFDSMLDRSNQPEKIFLTGIEPQVFKAVLHFIYTDTLPEDERSLVAKYACGSCLSTTVGAKLLAAADKYGIKRLKCICESHLWRSINLNRLEETLVLAERYNASRLKDLCLQFAASNIAALKELGTFAFLEKNYPLLFKKFDGDLSQERPSRQIIDVMNERLMASNSGLHEKQKKQAEEKERSKKSKLGLQDEQSKEKGKEEAKQQERPKTSQSWLSSVSFNFRNLSL